MVALSPVKKVIAEKELAYEADEVKCLRNAKNLLEQAGEHLERIIKGAYGVVKPAHTGAANIIINHMLEDFAEASRKVEAAVKELEVSVYDQAAILEAAAIGKSKARSNVEVNAVAYAASHQRHVKALISELKEFRKFPEDAYRSQDQSSLKKLAQNSKTFLNPILNKIAGFSEEVRVIFELSLNETSGKRWWHFWK